MVPLGFGLYFPGGQLSQVVMVQSGAMVPGGQESHESRPSSGACVPGMQGSQKLLLGATVKFPAGQGIMAAAPPGQ